MRPRTYSSVRLANRSRGRSGLSAAHTALLAALSASLVTIFPVSALLASDSPYRRLGSPQVQDAGRWGSHSCLSNEAAGSGELGGGVESLRDSATPPQDLPEQGVASHTHGAHHSTNSPCEVGSGLCLSAVAERGMIPTDKCCWPMFAGALGHGPERSKHELGQHIPPSLEPYCSSFACSKQEGGGMVPPP